MKIVSVRLNPSDSATFDAYARARDLPVSTAIKRLAQAGLKAQQSTQQADRSTLEKCLGLLRLVCALEQVQYQHLRLKNKHVGSTQREFSDAIAAANAELASDPGLFGNLRIPALPTTKS